MNRRARVPEGKALVLSSRNAYVLVAIALFVLTKVLLHHDSHGTASATAAAGTVGTEGHLADAENTQIVAPLSSNKDFVIAVVSAHRQGNANYLPRTLLSLYCSLDASGEQPSSWPAVLVINTEVPPSRHTALAEVLTAPKFSSYFQHGLTVLNVTSLHPQLHAPEYVLKLAARTSSSGNKGDAATSSAADPVVIRAHMAAGDTASRLWWRSKEALDTAYALEAGLQAAPTAQYVIFLQDDIQLAANFTQQLQSFINTRPNGHPDVISLFTTHGVSSLLVKDPWAVHYGGVALAFRRAVAQELTQHFRDSFADAPVDWMLSTFLQSRNRTLWIMQPSLVQHVGVFSSLPGKTQPAVSATFRDRTCWVEPSRRSSYY